MLQNLLLKQITFSLKLSPLNTVVTDGAVMVGGPDDDNVDYDGQDDVDDDDDDDDVVTEGAVMVAA